MGLKLLFVTNTGTLLTGEFVSRTNAQLHEGLGNGPVVNVWVPDDDTLQFDGYVEWSRFPPNALDNVFADANFWPNI